MITTSLPASSSISHQCLIRMQSIYPTLKTAEKKAADFLLQNTEILASASIVQAAKFAGCSEATYIRLAKKLGYSGYIELKAALLKKVDEQIHTIYGSFQSDEDPVSIATSVFRTSVQTINDTLSLLDPSSYNKAMDMMLRAKQFAFIGVGDAYVVAHAAFLKFYRIGMPVTCHQDYDLQLIDASRLDKDDVLFVISHSGCTRSALDIVKCVKNNGINVIAISNFPLSPIGKLSDIVLQTAAFTPDNFGEIITKRIPELCIIESLYLNMLIKMDPDRLKQMARTEEMLALNKV